MKSFRRLLVAVLYADDVVHQPKDVAFLIDQVLALDEVQRPFEGQIDVERIGVFGVSL